MCLRPCNTFNQHNMEIAMKSAKERTIERKRARREMNAKKTERSRTRRIANGKKRDEIHAVDPDFKVIIMNQRTYDEYGTEVVIDNGKIVAKELDNDIIEATIEFCKQPAEMITEKTDAVIAERMDAQVEEERLGMFSKLADKWRKK